MFRMSLPALCRAGLLTLQSIGRAAFLLFVLLIPVWGAIPAPAQEAPEGGRQRLVLLAEDDLPPHQFMDENGRPTGMLIELWRLWARRMDVEIEFRMMPWNEVLDAMRRGEGDVIIGIIQTPERDSWLDFTKPYFTSQLDVFVRNRRPDQRSLADLESMRIGVVQDDYGHVYLAENLPEGAQLRTYGGLRELLDAAVANEIDAFAGYRYSVRYVLAQRHLSDDFEALPRAGNAYELRAAVLEGDTELLQQLNAGLDLISEDERDAITMQWGIELQRSQIFWKAVLTAVAVVLLLGIILTLLYRRKLKRNIRTVEREQREKELAVAGMRTQEQRLRAFTNTLAGSLFILDLEGRYLEVLGPGDDLLVAPREELRTKTVRDVLDPVAARTIMDAIAESYRTRQLQVMEFEIDVPLGRRHFEGRVSYIPESPPEQPMFVLLALDATVQHHLGEQLRQAQKMEAIGRLAGGIAHDFNNILTAMIGFTELAMEDLHDPEIARKHLEEIRASADRASRLTRQLLAFSRRQVLEPRVINLNDTISGLEHMLQRLIGETIELVTDLAPDLHAVRADPGQIEQVVMNLAVNARDAMPDGGRLILRTRNLDMSSSSDGPTVSLRPGDYAVFEVVDTGIGIDEATAQRIFEPFFTTKERDKGTGLGLSTVYGIVKQSGGDIVCLSRPGAGATFRIYLPRCEGEAPSPITQSACDNAPAVASCAVLVVEDDPVVRALIRRLLENNGLTVLEAAHGGAAERLALNHGQAIRLLITDVVMPGVSGPELARRLQHIHPDLKVLFISGYSGGDMVKTEEVEQSLGLLLKPFHPDELMAKVREAIPEGTRGAV